MTSQYNLTDDIVGLTVIIHDEGTIQTKIVQSKALTIVTKLSVLAHQGHINYSFVMDKSNNQSYYY